MKPQRGGESRAASAGVAAPADDAVQANRTPGQLLRQERELRGLTLQQAAEALNLDGWILEAIEADHFLALGAPVYARGHLRKYAALLGLSQQLIVDRYDSLTETPSAPVVTTTTTAHISRRSRRERSGSRSSKRSSGHFSSRPRRRWVLLLLILLGASAAAWWWFSPPAFVASWFEGIVSGSTPAVTAPATPAETTTMLTNSDAGSNGQQVVGVLAAPLATQHAQSSVAPVKPVNLQLQFNAPSFVEAVDATGQRLMFETGKVGQSRDLHGAAPLDVIVSVASAVTLKVNDKPVALPRLPGKEATRFTVDADGSVR
jgi:cytoskeleton protein RodZ